MKKLNKLTATVLALVMCLSLMPLSVFAEEAAPVNPYQDKIEAANDVTENAGKPETKGENVDYTGVDTKLGEAASENQSATNKSGQVVDAAKDAEAVVSEAVETQQGLVNAAEKTASGDINGAAEAINGETGKVTAAVGEANKALAGVQEKLDALKDAELTPEEKAEAAKEAQTAADAAVKVAEDAAKVVETAQATVDAAMDKAKKAQEAYDAAVLAAQNAVGAAKDAAQAKLDEAKETLEGAKADLANATQAKKDADSAKETADGQLKEAQRLLGEAQKAYDAIDWPDTDIEKGSVTQGDIDKKNDDAVTASGMASQAQEKVNELADEIEELGIELGAKNTESGIKTEQKNLAQSQHDSLAGAKLKYDDAVETVEQNFNTAIQDAEKTYQEKAAEFYGTVVDKNGDWAKNQVALADQKDKDGNVLTWKNYLFFDYTAENPEIKISNSNFAYYLKISELSDGVESDRYKYLCDYYTQWKSELGTGSKYDQAADKCANVAEKFMESMTTAISTRADGLDTAKSTLKKTTDLETVEAVTQKIGELDRQISKLAGELETLNTRIQELNESIGEKSGEKTTQEGIVRDETAKANAAREAAQKLADLLALQEALEAAEAALEAAKTAQEAAKTAQEAAAQKLAAYNDAQAAVDAAEAALKAKLSGDLENGELSLIAGADFDKDLADLAAKLKEAQDAAKKAKEDYDNAKKTADDAKKDADDAKKDADDAKKDADKAKEDADRELEDFNNRYDGGDDTGDTGVTIEDELVPLASGPVTRAQFVDYLWRHEGSPAAESELFADHEYAPAIAWALSAELIGEDFQPDELVTVADVRAILGNFARVFGTNAVAVNALTTLAEDEGEAVLNCDEVLAEFFGEEYAPAKIEDIDIAA